MPAGRSPIVGIEIQDLNGSIISALCIANGFEIMMSVAIDLLGDSLRSIPMYAAADVQALEVYGAT